MKTPRLLLSVAAFATATLALPAALESARMLPDNAQPMFPNSLKLGGITKGRALIAVSVDAEGRVKDHLALAYSDVKFARASIAALRDWRFVPARLDGQPVPVQFELDFEYSIEGAVITSGIMEHFLYDRFDGGPNALAYRPANPAKVDRAPVRIGGEAPKYAKAAARDGIEGVVTVRFYIDEQGNVRMPAITHGANAYLSDQAMTAVRAWKFEPVTSRGAPVLVAAKQDFSFGR